jgi:hypothetical protein
VKAGLRTTMEAIGSSKSQLPPFIGPAIISSMSLRPARSCNLRAWLSLLLMVLSVRVAAAPVRRGTLDAADLSCSGYPETVCGKGTFGECFGLARSSVRPGVWSFRPADGASGSASAIQKTRLLAPWAEGRVHVDFAVKPLWVHSGAWSSEGSLLLADVLRGGLLHYSSTGSLLGTMASGPSPYPGSLSGIRPWGDGFLIREGGGRFLLLDSRYRVVRQWNLLAGKKGKRGEIRSIFQWSPLGQNILAFGDLLRNDGTWVSAWLRIPMAAPESFEILKTERPTDPSRRLYLLGNPYVASTGSTGYFFSAADFSVYEVQADGSRLRKIDLLERTPVPQGIYAWGEHVFLLLRSPVIGENGSHWSLAQMNPRVGSLTGGVLLPTHAKHLTVVPGPQFWALLEKGVLLGPGQQDVLSMTLVPPAWIERQNSPAPKRPFVNRLLWALHNPLPGSFAKVPN